jgi:ACS family D-galactonate transporter-like MFS transporter
MDHSEKPTRQRFCVMGMLFVSVVINYLDRSNLSIVAPRLSEELQLSPKLLGTTLSAFGWTYALFQIPASRLVDRIDPRLLYAITLALWSLGTLMMGFTGSILQILALRLVVGAFEAPSYPINNRIATTWFGETERAGVIGFYTSGQFVGLAFLTPLLTWMEVRFGWRFVFQATGVAGIVWAVAWWAWYRDPLKSPWINKAELRHISEGGGLPDLSRRLSQKGDSTFWKDLRLVLGSRKLWGIYIGQFGLSSTLWFFLTWFPTYLVRFRHIALASAGLMASVPFLAAFFGVLSGGILSDWLLRRGWSLTAARKTPVIAGLLLTSMVCLANLTENSTVALALLSCSFFGCGFASITWAVVSAMAPERLIGLTGGVFNFVSNCSGIVVPIAVGFLIRGDSFSLPLIFISLMALMGIASYLFLVGDIQRVEDRSIA